MPPRKAKTGAEPKGKAAISTSSRRNEEVELLGTDPSPLFPNDIYDPPSPEQCNTSSSPNPTNEMLVNNIIENSQKSVNNITNISNYGPKIPAFAAGTVLPPMPGVGNLNHAYNAREDTGLGSRSSSASSLMGMGGPMARPPQLAGGPVPVLGMMSMGAPPVVGGKVAIAAVPQTEATLKHRMKAMDKAKKTAERKERRRENHSALEHKRRVQLRESLANLEDTLNDTLTKRRKLAAELKAENRLMQVEYGSDEEEQIGAEEGKFTNLMVKVKPSRSLRKRPVSLLGTSGGRSRIEELEDAYEKESEKKEAEASSGDAESSGKDGDAANTSIVVHDGANKIQIERADIMKHNVKSSPKQPYVIDKAVECIHTLQKELELALKHIKSLEEENTRLTAEEEDIEQLKFMVMRDLVKPGIKNIDDHIRLFANTKTTLTYYKNNALKLYGFKPTGEYFRFDHDKESVDTGYPRPINDTHWTGMAFRDRINCAVNWGNGKAYFFSGRNYVSYDLATESADPGYPKEIQGNLPNISIDHVDAAINWGNEKIYLFCGSNYVRFDVKENSQDPGYPKPINSITWPGLFRGGVTNIVKWDETRAYFFQGDRYVVYNIKKDRAEGEPTTIYVEGAGTVGSNEPDSRIFAMSAQP
eukprot:Nk52_evm80s485 gene=Nk52_evmTU80s485